VAEPMTREQLIQYAKEKGLVIKEWEDFHNPTVQKILGIHVFNESNATVYVCNLSGVLIIYIEPKLLTTEIGVES